MKHNKYTKEQLIDAIKNSRSIRQALLNLNISAQGGNYRIIHKAIKDYDIDINHFTQKGWSKNKILGPKHPIEDYINNLKSIGSYRLKQRLLKEQILQKKCYNCESITWLDKEIPLELDHIDGNHLNNNLNNLRLLCPNCHALTETYRGKNQKRAKLGSV
jgi:5-methylcytosine-specific restriction endonuclease McrA